MPVPAPPKPPASPTAAPSAKAGGNLMKLEVFDSLPVPIIQNVRIQETDLGRFIMVDVFFSNPLVLVPLEILHWKP